MGRYPPLDWRHSMPSGSAAAFGLSCIAVFAVCLASSFVRNVVLNNGGQAVFWLVLGYSAFQPLPLLPRRFWRMAGPLLVMSWLLVAACLNRLGDPMPLFEWGWRSMTARFNMFQISVFGSAIVHAGLTCILNIHPVLVQNLRHLKGYKIQPDKAEPSVHDWYHCLVHIVGSQLLVQLPLVTGQYYFMKYFNIPIDYDTMPRFWDLAWRCALSLLVDDTWVYFGHRALHHRSVYKYIHKVHHTYTSPFAPDAEYEHPFETAFLGIGFFSACMFFTNHMVFIWAWLYVRLIVTYDSHSGYDLPFNMLHLIPFYNGAREHDWHHQFFNGMYAPTFQWWDRLFGTDAGFLKHQAQRNAKQLEKLGKIERFAGA